MFAARSLVPTLACVSLAGALAFPASACAQDRALAAKAGSTVASVADKASHGTQDLALYALGLIGVSYRYGGDTPETGLDCSGLVRHVFREVTGLTLPRTAREQSRLGGNVTRRELEPGDLVFFNTRRFAFSHVGIYLGDNRFIHAPHQGSAVEIAEFGDRYWQQRFNGARRLVGVSPALAGTVKAVPSLQPAYGHAAFAFDMTGG